MKKAMLLSGVVAVVGLTLVSCSSTTPETTTTTTRQTTVQTAAPPTVPVSRTTTTTHTGGGYWLPKPGRDCVWCRHGPVGHAFQKAALNSTGHKALATVVN